MAVAKPKEGASLYAKGVLNKIFRERTGKETKVVKRELLSEVAMGLIPGAPAVAKPLKILKPHAIGKVIIGAGRIGSRSRTRSGKGLGHWVSELLRAPQKELSRVKDIRARALSEHFLGRYLPASKAIELNPIPRRGRLTGDVIWHELTHGRQFEKLSYDEAMLVYDYLRKPIERQADLIAEVLTGGRHGVPPKAYSEIYKEAAKQATMIEDIGTPKRFLELFGR